MRRPLSALAVLAGTLLVACAPRQDALTSAQFHAFDVPADLDVLTDTATDALSETADGDLPDLPDVDAGEALLDSDEPDGDDELDAVDADAMVEDSEPGDNSELPDPDDADGADVPDPDVEDAGDTFLDTPDSPIGDTADLPCSEPCADDNPCTEDECTPALGCTHTPNAAPCDDSDACTTGDHCSGGECSSGDQMKCDDGTSCTVDGCHPTLGCTTTPTSDGQPCSDGNACTITESCQAGLCTGGAPVTCPVPVGTTLLATGATFQRSDEDATLGFTYVTGGDQAAAILAAAELPLDPTQPVWDQGTWARWLNGPSQICTFSHATARRFHTTITLSTAQAALATGLVLADKWGGTASLPSNDGLGLVVNGELAGYRVAQVQGELPCRLLTGLNCVASTFNVTLVEGVNTIDVIGIDNCTDGGMGEIDLLVRIGKPSACLTAPCDPATGCGAPKPVPDGAICDDSDPCTQLEQCTQGACAGAPVDCDDGLACTADACDSLQGCRNTVIPRRADFSANIDTPLVDATQIEFGDFNRDGRPDLAASQTNGHVVAIFLQDGAGALGQPADLPAPLQPFALVVADFDRDGNLDVTVGSPASTTPHFRLFPGDGAGGFGAVRETSLPPASHILSMAAADVDRDGILDLAVANGLGNSLRVLRGLGTGFFEPGNELVFGAVAATIRAGDLDRDGDPDLVGYARGTATSAAFLKVYRNDGGTFSSGKAPIPIGILWTDPGLPVNLGDQTVALEDLDRDGQLDLAVTDLPGGMVRVLLGVGDGFVAAPNVTTMDFPVALMAADVDGDGPLDLVLSEPGGGIGVHSGNGDGTFQARRGFAANSAAPPGDPHSLALADFDRDGALDLMASNPVSDRLTLRRNQRPPGSIALGPAVGLAPATVAT